MAESLELEQNLALVRRYFDEINNLNAGVLDELLLPGYVDHTPPPFPDLQPGREGARRAFREARRSFPDGWHESQEQIADGDRVLTRIRAGGTFVDELIGIPPTGKPVRMSGIAVHRVEDGKLAEHWGIQDLAGLFRQVGLMPGPVEEGTPQPAPSGSPTERAELDALVERFLRVFNQRDLAPVDEMLVEDFHSHTLGLGQIKGRAAWKQFVEGFFVAFPDVQFTLRDRLLDPAGGRIGLRWTWTGTQTGDLMDVPATGRAVHGHGIGVYHCAGGRLVSEDAIEDVFGMLVQMGVVPPPGQTAVTA